MVFERSCEATAPVSLWCLFDPSDSALRCAPMKVAKSCGLFQSPSNLKLRCLEEVTICSSTRAPSLDEIVEPSKYPRVVVPIDGKSLGLSRGVADVGAS